MEIRSFLNTDTHKIAQLWRNCSKGQRIFDSMTASILEDTVFSKPYFDPSGLIVAEESSEIVGMGLVGFCPQTSGEELNCEEAILSRLMVDSKVDWESVAIDILNQVETYAKRQGSRHLSYGSVFPHAPFFCGAYGGSMVPGVLEPETQLLDLLRAKDFHPVDQIDSFHSSLSEFRPLVNRQQITVKRQCKIVMHADPKPVNWYAACNFGNQNCIDFSIVDRKTDSLCGNLRFWEIQPLSGMWGRRSAGLYFLEIEPEVRRSGLATLLLGDSFRQLHELGFASTEVQIPRSDSSLCGLFQKLGFEHIGRGTQLRKVLQ